VGLISGIANQIFNHAILHPGSMTWYEITIILVSCVAAGGLGGFIGRATLAEQETLYRASQAIGVVASLQNIVDAIGEHLADPQVSHVALWRDASDAEDEASMEISLLAVWMPLAARIWGPGVWRPGLRLDTAQVPALKNLRRQSPLVLRTRKLPASERAVWEHQGIRSAVLLPLITSSGARVGLLMVASRSYGFSRVKERTYLTIGAQVALVLENLRLIEQAQQAGVSSERQRLAQEIHDTLAGAFTSIVMKLEAAEESLDSDRSSVKRFLDQARGIARESLAEARRLMWALRPESLERSSLSEALANLAERWSEECGVDASATVTGTPHPLTPDIEVTLMRVAQEALTNCRKYSQARRVTLTLSYMNNLVALNVQDDGVGFDPAEHHPDSSDQSTGGFGIMGMRERVEQLRGTLLVESAFGEGTTLMVAIPVAQDKRSIGSTRSTRTSAPLRGETS
jgi:signal transduction histidine kinase